MNFVTLLHGAAAIFSSFHHFCSQTLTHGLFRALAGRFTQPAHGQSSTASRTNFNRNLIVCTADATGLDFDHRTDIGHGSAENFERILASLGGNDVECAVNDAFGNRLLAALHDGIHKLGNFNITELGIRKNVTFWYFTTTGHINLN